MTQHISLPPAARSSLHRCAWQVSFVAETCKMLVVMKRKEIAYKQRRHRELEPGGQAAAKKTS